MLILNHPENTPSASEILVVQSILQNRGNGKNAPIQKAKLDNLLKLAYDNLTAALKSLKNDSNPLGIDEETRAAIMMSELVTDLVEQAYHYQNPEMTDVIRKKLAKVKQEFLIA
jgi:hypothetical protein